MTQFECTGCGQLGRFLDRHGPFELECPACGERTRWERAFTAPADGVEF